MNLTINMLHIQTPLRLNQLMTTKWFISWNYYTQNMMMIFWMLTFRCFSLDWWYLLLQNFIQALLCCFINMDERILQSQIAYNTKATVKLANGNTGHAQVFGIILCHFPNHFIIYLVVPVYYFPGLPSSTISSGALKFYVCFKILHLNLSSFSNLFTLRVVLGNHYTRLKTVYTIFRSKLSNSTNKKREYYFPNCLCPIKTKYISAY